MRRFAGEQGPHLARSVEKHVRWFWRVIMCPLLFGIIGTQMNFSNLPNGTISKAVAIIFAGAFPSLLPRVTCTHCKSDQRENCKRKSDCCCKGIPFLCSFLQLSKRLQGSLRYWGPFFQCIIGGLGAGLGIRVPISYAVMHFSGFNWKEKIFFAIAWTPKVQPQLFS